MKHRGYIWVVEQVDKRGIAWPLWGEKYCVGNTREQVRRGIKLLREYGHISKLRLAKYYRANI